MQDNLPCENASQSGRCDIESQRKPATLPARALMVFVILQLLDILTTLLGIGVGAAEASVFVGRLMRFGPLPALLISKIIGVALLCIAFLMGRPRVIGFLNLWFCGLVTWNLLAIAAQLSIVTRAATSQ